MCQVITCQNRGACKVYECPLPLGLQVDQEASIEIAFDFNKKTAVEKFEQFTEFLVAVSLCTPDSSKSKVCVDNRYGNNYFYPDLIGKT